MTGMSVSGMTGCWDEGILDVSMMRLPVPEMMGVLGLRMPGLSVPEMMGVLGLRMPGC